MPQKPIFHRPASFGAPEGTTLSGDPIAQELLDRQALQEQSQLPPWKQGVIGGLENIQSAVEGFFSDSTVRGNSTASEIGKLLAAAPGVGTGIKGLYSRLGKAVEGLGQRGKAGSVLNQLKKYAHPEEIEYTGVGKLLKERGQADVSRDELIRQMESKPLKVDVKAKGEPMFEDPRFTAGGPPESPTTYDTYQMPGSIPGSYRETLLKLPHKGHNFDLGVPSNIYDDEAMKQFGVPYDELDAERAVAVKEQIVKLDQEARQSNFNDTHFPGESNILAFVRHNERNLPTGNATPRPDTSNMNEREIRQTLIDQYSQPKGPKGRMLENVQSGWHQKGAKEGYNTGAPSSTDITNAIRRGSTAWFDDATPGEVDTLNQLLTDYTNGHINYTRLQQHLDTVGIPMPADASMVKVGGVPDAPFKDSRWVDLALKQQLMDVSQRPDLEWLGIAPVEQSIQRGEAFANPNSMSRRIHESLPGRLQKLIGPFGGKVEQKGIGLHNERDVPWITDRGMGEIGTDEETLASAWPKYEPPDMPDDGIFDETYWERTPDGRPLHQQLVNDVATTQNKLAPPPEEIKAWIATLSPEVKQAILKSGLPLLSVYMMMHPGQEPAR